MNFLSDFQKLNGPTWFYLSFLLMIAVYFRFERFFSLRNWDIVGLFLFVPGLLMTNHATQHFMRQLAQKRPNPGGNVDQTMLDLVHYGYIWLFAVTGICFIRALLDLVIARRPRLDPNLNISGMSFLAISLSAFLTFEAMNKPPDPSGRASARAATLVLQGRRPIDDGQPHHPAVSILMVPAAASVKTVADRMPEVAVMQQSEIEVSIARSAVILCHLLILTALILIGWQHFESPVTGVAMATLYLLVPITAMNIEKIDHLLPSVFIIWAVYAYRRPLISGLLLGMAGVFFFPLFLLPLWTGFFWRRGHRRFLIGVAAMTAVVWVAVWLLGPLRTFMESWTASVAWKAWYLGENPESFGFWTQATQYYRLPIFIVFCFMTIAVAFWPKEKNLGELIAISAALILGVQFWYADRGGAYIHWYLPLLLLMIFRPNLSGIRPPEIINKPAPA